MSNLNSVLKKWANKVLAETEDYDINEGVSMQYDLTETFFYEVCTSRGWLKALTDHQKDCQEYLDGLSSEQKRNWLAQELLENKIELILKEGNK